MQVRVQGNNTCYHLGKDTVAAGGATLLDHNPTIATLRSRVSMPDLALEEAATNAPLP